MKKSYEAIAKKLLGVKYERLLRSVASIVIIYVVFVSMDIGLRISSVILAHTITAFTSAVVLQTLGSDDNTEYLKGMLLLPIHRLTFNLAYFLAIALYTLATKAGILIALLAAVAKLNLWHVAGAIVLFLNGCLIGFICFALQKRAMWASVLIFFVELGLCVNAGHPTVISIIVGVSIVTLMIILLRTDSYNFLKNGEQRRQKKHKAKKGLLAFPAYMFRYVKYHKSYAANTLALLCFGVMFAFVFGEMGVDDFLPLGFGVLAINTPLGVFLSSDRQLRKEINMLPGQFKLLAAPYCGVVFLVTMLVYAVYMLSWTIINGPVKSVIILAALVFAAQAAILTVYLEWYRPLENWTVETDLWHNPRKYIVPAVLLIQSVVVASYWWGILVSAALVLFELMALLLEPKLQWSRKKI